MKVSRKYEIIGYALLIVALFAAIVIFVSASTEGSFFGMFGWMVLVGLHYGGIFIGFIFILLRIFKMFKNPVNILYLIIAFINLFVGLSNIDILISGQVPPGNIWYAFLVNLLIGLICLLDVIITPDRAKTTKA